MLGELSQDQSEHLLRREVVGRIGCHADGQTYIVPVTYAYDGVAVYCHSADGLKLSMMRRNPDVCFEVDHVDGLAEWQSVIAWGRFEELTGDAAARGLRVLVDRLRPLVTSRANAPSHGVGPEAHGGDAPRGSAVIYRIVLGARTGRYERR